MLKIHNVFIIQKLKKCEVDLKKSGCSEQSREAEATRDFHYDCENFDGNAKISQSYRNFCNPSEIFAM